MKEYDKLVAKHYESHWGKPAAAYEIDWSPGLSPEGSFHVVEYAPYPEHDVWTYASVGMGVSLMPGEFPAELGEPRRRRVELVAYCQPRCTDLVEFLGHLVVFPFDNSTTLWSGHTVPGDTAVASGSQMTSVYFSFPELEAAGFQSICLNAEHIYVLWAIPIHETERQYKVTHGAKALRQLLEEKDVEVWNLGRSSAV